MSKNCPQKQDKIVHIRLTSEEFFLLNQKKNRAELARWMRETLLSDESTKQITTVKHQLPPEVVRFLGGIGNNLNQIARNVNAAAKSGDMGQLDAIKILTKSMPQTVPLLDCVIFYASKISHDCAIFCPW